MNDKIPLPIELYYSLKTVLSLLMLGLGMFGLVYFTLDIADDKFIISLGIFLMIVAIIITIASIIMLINPKPVLTITRYRLIYGHATFRKLFRLNRSFAFKDIRSIELDYYTQKDMKYWYLNVILNTGKDHKLSLKPMKYENIMINEKEIFHLIEQVHQGQIPPTFVDFEMDIHDRMTGFGIFMIAFMSMALVVAIIMGIK